MHANPAIAAYAAPHGSAAPAAPASMSGALYAAALGPLGTPMRYLAAFERFDATGRALPGWNAAGAFCTIGWMVFRRLWAALLLYLAALVALAGLLGALWLWGGALPAPVLAGLMLALVLVAFALPGLYGDALLHRHVQRQVADAVAAAPTMREAIARLEQRASSRTRLMGVAAAGAVLVVLAGAAAALYALRVEGERALRQMPAPQIPMPPPAQETQPARVEAASAAPAPAELSAVPDVAAPASPTAVAEASVEVSSPAAPPASVPSASASAPAAAATAGDGHAGALQAATAVQAPGPRAKAARAERVSSAPSSSRAADGQTPDRRLYVNVGLFARAANARRAHARLQLEGLPSALQEVTAAGGRRLQRVRVGPFASSAEANAAAARVRNLGLDAAPAAE